MRRNGTALRVALYAGGLAIVALILGFIVFANTVTRSQQGTSEVVDGIVVLTGGPHRIAVGMKLLQAGMGKRLLISGVNPITTRREVRRLVRADNRLFACCVDVGYAAKDTIGNAVEARAWARRNGYHRLVVVTASYHMPRSMSELALAMPDVQLLAHPVVSPSLADQSWWLSASMVRLLAGEYLKLLPAVARFGAGRLIRSFDRDEARLRGGERTTIAKP